MLLTRSFVYQNAIIVDKEYSIPEIWHKIHEYAFDWMNMPISNIQEKAQNDLDNNTISIMRDLNEVPAKKWAALCSAAGWTAYGAAAISWCQDADKDVFWECWNQTKFILKPQPENMRPARLVNPQIFPNTCSLRELGTFFNFEKVPVCMGIAAMEGDLIFDMSSEQLHGADPQFAAFFAYKMMQKQELLQEETSLLNVWNQTAKGTEFEFEGKQ